VAGPDVLKHPRRLAEASQALVDPALVHVEDRVVRVAGAQPEGIAQARLVVLLEDVVHLEQRVGCLCCDELALCHGALELGDPPVLVPLGEEARERTQDLVLLRHHVGQVVEQAEPEVEVVVVRIALDDLLQGGERLLTVAGGLEPMPPVGV
jgi:hypothetical protein